MRDPAPGLDPVQVRLSLELSRAQGVPFEEAWRSATRQAGDDPATVRFMHKHFRAAYYNTGEKAGRCMVPERDVSKALMVVRESAPRRDRKRCQSGDGCEHEATHGRHAMMWCEYHFVELERIREKYETSTAAAAGAYAIRGLAA